MEKKPEGWERRFFERFGANKIWVTPSRDNVETILEIHAFFSEELSRVKKIDDMRDKIDEYVSNQMEEPTQPWIYVPLGFFLAIVFLLAVFIVAKLFS